MYLSTQLSAQQRQELQDALIDAYPDTLSLRIMLSNQLNRNLHEVAEQGNLTEVVFNLIAKANAEHWHIDLINGASIGNPNNYKLSEFVSRYNPQPTSESSQRKNSNPSNSNSPGSESLKDIGGNLLCAGGLGLIFLGVVTKTVLTTSSLGCFCVIGAVIIFVRDSPI